MSAVVPGEKWRSRRRRNGGGSGREKYRAREPENFAKKKCIKAAVDGSDEWQS